MSRRTTRRTLARLGVAAAAIALFADPALAHVGGLSGSVADAAVPSWLTVLTGGVVVGASFLGSSLLTDHAAIRAVNGAGLSVRVPPGARVAARRVGGALGVAVLALVLWSGFAGTTDPTTSPAILVVWAGWWAAFTVGVYLVGNAWPLVDPWRRLARVVPSTGERAYPERVGAWPSVAGLLALVLVEVVSPVAADPRFLAAVVAAYTAVTLAGAGLFGADAWFERVDPIARVFRWYGRAAPVQRTGDGLAFRLPTAALTETGGSRTRSDAAFVVALLWATTYDGLVTTTAWADLTRAAVGAGVPPLAVYLLTMAGGFGLFLGAYRLAARAVRDTADSYVAAGYVERWFAPSLVPIAAGYHLAHYLGYAVSLWPALTAAVDPTGAGTAMVLTLPAWFGTLQLLFVVAGHLLAVWVAHALAIDLFPGVLTPIRSQYPFVLVMVLYTMVSVWVVAQPFTPPPYT